MRAFARVRACMLERHRQTETDRETDTERDRDTQRGRERETERLQMKAKQVLNGRYLYMLCL